MLLVVVSGEELLDECLVVSDDRASEKCLLRAGLVQRDHAAQLALAGLCLLLNLPALLLAADNVQSAIMHKMGDFHDGQQVEAMADFVVDSTEGRRLWTQPLYCLPLALPLFDLLKRHSMQLVSVISHHKAFALSFAVRAPAHLHFLEQLQPLYLGRLLLHILQLVERVLLLERGKGLVLSRG